MLYCLWLTLPEEDDQFIIETTKALLTKWNNMSEKEQIKFIKQRIIGKTNEELAKVCWKTWKICWVAPRHLKCEVFLHDDDPWLWWKRSQVMAKKYLFCVAPLLEGYVMLCATWLPCHLTKYVGHENIYSPGQPRMRVDESSNSPSRLTWNSNGLSSTLVSSHRLWTCSNVSSEWMIVFSRL